MKVNEVSEEHMTSIFKVESKPTWSRQQVSFLLGLLLNPEDEAIYSYEFSVYFHRNTWRHILEDKTLSLDMNVEAVSLVTKVWIRNRKMQVWL
jgi:hypothetical protein